MVLNCLSINVHTCILISLIYSLTIIITVASEIAITNDDTSTEIDGGPITSAKIVENIRKTMNNAAIVNVPIQAYIIPPVDAHQNEYPTIRDNRVRYVSGFTGSSATIVIAECEAAIWITNPYYSQAEREIDDKKTWKIMKMGMDGVPTFRRWLIDTLPKSSRVGIDQYLITSRDFHDLNEFLEANGHKLVSLPNLVDVVWKDRPEAQLNELEPIDQTVSGKIVLDKFTDVRKALKQLNADSLMITSLEDIAWLLNLRGSDFHYLPVFFAYAIITETNCFLYLLNHERGKNNKIDNHFQTEHIDVDVREYNETLTGINSVIRTTKGRMLLSSASEAITSVVPVERRLEAGSPILGMRIIKNEVEANGIREAHRRDGAAIIQYLYWLQTEINDQNITEMKGAERLKDFKKSQDLYRRLGSPTVSAVGSHSAMVRYIPTDKTDKRITDKEIYLLNAATQYKDGSTAMTRTIHIGTPSDKQKDSFTRVLKGFISVATAIFPPNASFSYFDAMARRALWDVGLDYNHETGHGIGAYLNIREIPPLLSSQNSPPGMRKNMFTTNEPGVYEDDAFGIRIQNVLQVTRKSDSSHYFGGKGAYQFDDITMVPIQTKLINIDLLTQSEVDWINAYHIRVRDNISPLLSNNSNIIEWLHKETEPISKRKEDCKS